ncbi:MAG: acyl carrier protein [Kiloniellales bacterium]
MDMPAIKDEVRQYILKEFLPGESADSLQDTIELISSGILDSLATLKLVAFLEETYGINVQPHELDADNLNTIAHIADFVASKRGWGGPRP